MLNFKMRTDQKLFCLKVVLSIFLILLWLIGAVVFGVLLWLRLDFWTNEYLDIDPSLNKYLVLIYLALASGLVIVVFSIFGLIGGCIRKKWLIVMYLIGIILAIFLVVGAVVYGIIYKEELRDTVVNSNLIKDVIKEHYIDDDGTSKITRSIDIMQAELECCGGEGPWDYQESNWGSKHDANEVPATCCKDYIKTQDKTKLCTVKSRDTYADNLYSEYTWLTGCQEELTDFFWTYINVVIAIGAAFFVLMLVCLIICSCYIHLLNSLYVPQPDDIVYDMAHNQEKSPYPSRGDYREYYH